jgi:hypothetical protein
MYHLFALSLFAIVDLWLFIAFSGKNFDATQQVGKKNEHVMY